jgi:fibronectin-binding autotransporter adhesin
MRRCAANVVARFWLASRGALAALACLGALAGGSGTAGASGGGGTLVTAGTARVPDLSMLATVGMSTGAALPGLDRGGISGRILGGAAFLMKRQVRASRDFHGIGPLREEFGRVHDRGAESARLRRKARKTSSGIVARRTLAHTIVVTNTADDGSGSLRQALALAANGDTINITAKGTITLTSGELLVDKSVTIRGPGATKLIVNGTAASRVFHIAPATSVAISGLTIANGHASDDAGSFPANAGGGIYSDHARLTVSDCTVSGNAARYGGGIFSNNESGDGSLSVVTCTASGNSARFGGGIYNDGEGGSANLTLNRSVVNDNTADFGGAGIYNDGEANGIATLVLVTTALKNNSAGIVGGAIHNDGENGHANSTLNACELSSNSAGADSGTIAFSGGGAIFNDGFSGNALLTLRNCVVNNNQAGTHHADTLAAGGGVYNHGYAGNAVATLTNSTFSHNAADQAGGGVANYGVLGNANVTLNTSSVSNGEAPVGGGISNFGPSGAATLTLNNGSVKDNGAFDGGGIENLGAALTMNKTSVSGNEVGFGGGGIDNEGWAGTNTTATLVDSTISNNKAGAGSAIYNIGFDGSAAVTLTNSTVSGNLPDFSSPVTTLSNIGYVGDATMTLTNSTVSGNGTVSGNTCDFPVFCDNAIFNGNSIGTIARLTVSNSTMSNNWGISLLNGGDGDGNAIVDIANTILNAEASGGAIQNFFGTVTSHGYNLSSDAAGGDGSTIPGGLLDGPGDIRNTDPLLGPLKDNGGPTMTHALLAHSPGIDAGDPSFDPYDFDPPLLYDQRDGPGFPRIVNKRVDIGAVESRHS